MTTRYSFIEILENNRETDEFLEHYGVKGMKWRVRKRGEGKTHKDKIRQLGQKAADNTADTIANKLGKKKTNTLTAKKYNANTESRKKKSKTKRQKSTMQLMKMGMQRVSKILNKNNN